MMKLRPANPAVFSERHPFLFFFSYLTSWVNSMMRFDIGIVAEQEIAYLSPAEMPTWMAHRAEEQRRELIFDELGVFGHIAMQTVVDNVMGSP